jgi:hypothetical protein
MGYLKASLLEVFTKRFGVRNVPDNSWDRVLDLTISSCRMLGSYNMKQCPCSKSQPDMKQCRCTPEYYPGKIVGSSFYWPNFYLDSLSQKNNDKLSSFMRMTKKEILLLCSAFVDPSTNPTPFIIPARVPKPWKSLPETKSSVKLQSDTIKQVGTVSAPNKLTMSIAVDSQIGKTISNLIRTSFNGVYQDCTVQQIVTHPTENSVFRAFLKSNSPMSHFCHRKQACHSNNRIFFSIERYSQSIYQLCFSQSCKAFQGLKSKAASLLPESKNKAEVPFLPYMSFGERIPLSSFSVLFNFVPNLKKRKDPMVEMKKEYEKLLLERKRNEVQQLEDNDGTDHETDEDTTFSSRTNDQSKYQNLFQQRQSKSFFQSPDLLMLSYPFNITQNFIHHYTTLKESQPPRSSRTTTQLGKRQVTVLGKRQQRSSTSKQEKQPPRKRQKRRQGDEENERGEEEEEEEDKKEEEEEQELACFKNS